MYGFRGPFVWTNLLGEFQAHQDTCQWPQFRWQGRRYSWRRAEASAVNKYCSFLSSYHILPGHRWLLTSYLWCLRAIFLRQWYKELLNYLYHGSWPADSTLHPTPLPWPSSRLSSIFAILKKRFLEFANDCDAAWASEAVWAGGFISFPGFWPHAGSEVSLLPWKT